MSIKEQEEHITTHDRKTLDERERGIKKFMKKGHSNAGGTDDKDIIGGGEELSLESVRW